MGLRKLEAKDLVGKKIVSANCDSVNVTELEFDDNTKISVYCEPSIYVPSAGEIWGFFVDDESATENSDEFD